MEMELETYNELDTLKEIVEEKKRVSQGSICEYGGGGVVSGVSIVRVFV